MIEDRLLQSLAALTSRAQALFSSKESLHNASFAKPHELGELLTHTLDSSSLLLAETSFNHLLRVTRTSIHRELGNCLVVARTRGGKGLLACAQLLTWRHSAVVNDIKGELFAQTAGYRRTLGPVYVIDPTGLGHRFDPFRGRTTEDKLYSSAKHLLFEPREASGIVFTQRATKMLTQLFLAAIAENCQLLTYVRRALRLNLKGAADRLQLVSPELATAFLDGEIEDTNFEDDRFLISAWGTLSSRLFPLLTENAIRSFSGSDFTPEALLVSPKPITVYLRWPEADLLSLSPLVRLVWEALIHTLISFYDKQAGKNCNPVLLVMDEAGRSAIPHLPEYASTVCGRGITLQIFVQSLSQLDSIYGRARSDDLRNNCETQIYYRPSSQETAEYIERCLGKKSGFARSQSTHGESQTTQAASEQAVPLLTAQEIKRLTDEQVIVFHRNLAPILARRIDWRRLPLLQKRVSLPKPPVPSLPVIEDNFEQIQAGEEPVIHSSWQPDPALLRWGSRTPILSEFD